MVEITEEKFRSLVQCAIELEILEVNGVDNWACMLDDPLTPTEEQIDEACEYWMECDF